MFRSTGRQRMVGSFFFAALFLFLLVAMVMSMPTSAFAEPDPAALADLMKVKARTLELLTPRGRGRFGSAAVADIETRTEAIMARPFERLEWPDKTEYHFSRRLNSFLGPAVTLAEAWACPASRYHHDAAVLGRVLLIVDNALEHFNPDTPRPGNWYYWLIQVPDKLGTVALLVESELPDAMRARLEAALVFQLREMLLNGANAAWEARNHCFLAMLQRDPDRLGRAAGRIFETVKASSDGGVREDYGYLFHGHIPYAGTYGSGFVETVGQFMFLFDDTRWAAAPAKAELLAGTLLEHFRWLAMHNTWDLHARGRAFMARGTVGGALDAMLYLTRVADAGQDVIAAAAGMLAEGARPSSATAALADAVADGPIDLPRGFRHWYTCDMGVYKGADYHVGYRLFSRRVQDYEYLTEVGGTGWFMAYGFTYLTRTGDELFRAVISDSPGMPRTAGTPHGSHGHPPITDYDWERLPGATARLGAHDFHTPDDIPGGSLNFGTSTLSGGTGLDEVGMAAFRLEPVRGDFTALKSLSFFPGGYVALGSAITADERSTAADAEGDDPAAPVLTGVLQWPAPETSTPLLISGIGAAALDEQPRRFEGVRWCFVDGVGAAFFEPTTVYARRVGRVVSVWLDHGTAPRDAGYAFAVLPRCTPERIETFAAQPPVRIQRCDAGAHALVEEVAGTRMAAFFEPGEAAGIASDSPAIVCLRTDARGVQFALQNPLHTRRRITLDLPVEPGLDFYTSTSTSTAATAAAVELALAESPGGLASGLRRVTADTLLGRIYRGGFGEAGAALRPAPRLDLSNCYSFRVAAENTPRETLLTLHADAAVLDGDYELFVEGCRGHRLRAFKPGEAAARPAPGVVQFRWPRVADAEAAEEESTGGGNTRQIEGDFRVLLTTARTMATCYITVPRFDEQGRPSWPDDLPEDRNKTPAPLE